MTDPTSSPSAALRAVQRWLEEQIVGQERCPYARGPFERGQVHLVEVQARTDVEILAAMVAQAHALVAAGEGTTLLVLPLAQGAAADFQALFHRAEDHLSQAGFDRRVQVMAFHPGWTFEDLSPDDPRHAVQRSPVPVLHLLRWADVAAAIAGR